MDVSERELREIAGITTESSYAAGEIIIEENSKAEAFFIIYHGKIEILKKLEDGDEFVLGVYSDGEFFGEMAILDEGPRSATARAVDPTTVLQVSYKDFDHVLMAAPRIAYSIMKELSTRLRQTGALLVWHLKRKNRELSEAYIYSVKAVVRALEDRDSYLIGHSERVARLAVAIGRQMELPEIDIHSLDLGGLLHDVGMIGVSGAVLSTPRELNEKEYGQVKKHSEIGKRMIEKIPYLHNAIPHVLYHHERYDGSGYPENLSGREIPLAGRIIAVADVFDALTTDRPQRKKMGIEAAAAHIAENAGRAFDPEVTEAFARLLHSGYFLTEWNDTTVPDAEEP